MAPQLLRFQKRELESLAENAEKWTLSPQGERAIKESGERASETAVFLAEKRSVDPQRIREPLTL